MTHNILKSPLLIYNPFVTKVHDEADLQDSEFFKPTFPADLTEFKNRARTEPRKEWECMGCGSKFTTFIEFKKHKLLHREKSLACPHCVMKFIYQSQLDVHVRVHTGDKPYVCTHEGCTKAYKRRSHLDGHLSVHSGKRPYICEFPKCNKTFIQKGTLKLHQLTHTQVKDFVCNITDYCTKAFTLKC